MDFCLLWLAVPGALGQQKGIEKYKLHLRWFGQVEGVI